MLVQIQLPRLPDGLRSPPRRTLGGTPPWTVGAREYGHCGRIMPGLEGMASDRQMAG